MADQPRDQDKSKDESPKKQAETVNLTAEELRAISGGANVFPATPYVTVGGVGKQPKQ